MWQEMIVLIPVFSFSFRIRGMSRSSEMATVESESLSWYSSSGSVYKGIVHDHHRAQPEDRITGDESLGDVGQENGHLVAFLHP